MTNDKQTMIETALELDVSTLPDTEYFEQQCNVEKHYNRAAELYFQNETELAELHMDAAYESATYLRDMVVHDLGMGSTWGRIKREVLEQ